MVTQPPPPSTPSRLPWGESQAILNRLDRLIALMERQVGVEPGPPVEEPKYPERFAVTPPTRIVVPPGLSTSQLLERLLAIAQRTSLYAFGREALWLAFTDSIAALSEAREAETIPFPGVIPTVVTHFPDGPVTTGGTTLVDVRLLYESDFVVPGQDNEWLSFNDQLLVFPVNETVEAGKSLYFERKNYDSAYAHTVSAFALLLRQGS